MVGGIVVVGIVVVGIVVGGIVVGGGDVVVVDPLVFGGLGGLGFDESGVHAASSPSSPTTSNSPAAVRGALRWWAGSSDDFGDLSNAMTPAPFGKVDARLHHRDDERVGDRDC